MTYVEHHIGELHEFRITAQLLENLARCIERDCQLPSADEADTPQMLFMKAQRRASALRVAVHRILLTMLAAEPPVHDLAILKAIGALRDSAVSQGCNFENDDKL
jgi:hypothetical protein